MTYKNNNKNNKLLHRFLSLFLSFALCLGVVPLEFLELTQKFTEVVYANAQKHVSNVHIRNYGSDHPAYVFDLHWTNPYTWDTGTSEEQDGPFQMIIGKRNATKTANQFENIATINTRDLGDIAVNPDDDLRLTGSNYPTLHTLDQTGLTSGTLYEYKMEPIHFHEYFNLNYEWIVSTATYDPGTPLETTLFMTDLELSAVGQDNTLTVTFDNPTYDGRNIFDAYKIYYQQGGEAVGDTFNSSVEVNIDNLTSLPSDPTREGVAQVSYTITDDKILPGTVYAVKIEPMLDGREIRDPAYTQVVEINNTYKNISFNPRDTYPYRINDGVVALGLNVEEDGDDYLKLVWGQINVAESEVSSIEILMGYSEDNITTKVGELYSMNAVAVNTWRMEKPTNITYFKIKVNFQGTPAPTPMESIIAVYDPSQINITPNTPNLFAEDNVGANTVDIDLYWDVFERTAYSASETELVDPDTGLLIDRNVYYTFYVTDQLAYLNDPDILPISDELTDLMAQGLKEEYYNEHYDKKVFNTNINTYSSKDEYGVFQEYKLEQNRTYYIKLKTYKYSTSGQKLHAPDVEIQVYVAAKGEIATPKAISTPPLRIKLDDNGEEMITQTEITIEWNTSWFEVFNPADETWHTEVALVNGALVYGKDISSSDTIIDFYNVGSEQNVFTAFELAGYSNIDSLVVRHMDISQSDIEYELIFLTFDEINQGGGYEAYIENLLAGESELWEDIDPTFVDPRYAEYYFNGLQNNTRYAALLRPYRITSDGKKESYPAYILGTTLPDDVDLDVIPTTPVLYPVSTTDVSLKVEWPHDLANTTYELAYNELIIDDPTTATYYVTSDEIAENANSYLKDSDGRTYLQYENSMFFPQTGFYIWIRSTVGGNTSQWSNPIYMTTDNIKIPDPPQGLGPASDASLRIYNAKNNTEYYAVDSNHLILEWRRDQQDDAVETVAEPVENIEPIIDPDIVGNYLAKFDGLLGNKLYYARAKTKVYVTKFGDEIVRQYTYIVEVSINSDFKDSLIIEMPTIDYEGDKYLSAESEWTNTLRIRTDKDAFGDYDENIFDDLYPLPNDDFEIIYNELTQTLTYRFRGNSVDANGDADNLVDQRLISTLINNQIFNYNIDLTSYIDDNEYKVISNRIVEIPYSIVSTLQDRKITLSLTMGGTRIALNPGFTDTYQAKSIGTLSDNSKLRITIQENSAQPTITKYQTYTTIPQKISMRVENDGRTVNLTYTGSDMDILMSTNNSEVVNTRSVSAYRDVVNSDWQPITSSYDLDKSLYKVEAVTLGNYATIATLFYSEGEVPADQVGNATTGVGTGTDIIQFNNSIRILDDMSIDPNEVVQSNQLNNVMAALVTNQKEFNVHTPVSLINANALSRAGLLVGGEVVSREAGIASLVQLYELKTGYKVEPITTYYKDAGLATSAYQQYMVKAADIGFFGEEGNVRPKEVLNWGELAYMMNIILEDTRY